MFHGGGAPGGGSFCAQGWVSSCGRLDCQGGTAKDASVGVPIFGGGIRGSHLGTGSLANRTELPEVVVALVVCVWAELSGKLVVELNFGIGMAARG